MSYAQSNSVRISVTLNVLRNLCYVNLQPNAVPFVLTGTRNLSLQYVTRSHKVVYYQRVNQFSNFPRFFFLLVNLLIYCVAPFVITKAISFGGRTYK